MIKNTIAKIKILHLEDLPSDAEMVDRVFRKGNIDFEKLVVDNRADFEKALVSFSPDIILSDHTLPHFDSIQALQIVKESGIKIPFILITATVSEEYAVEVMKLGAYDYILKDHLQRLPNAVINAIEKSNAEKDKDNFVNLIINNEQQFRHTLDNMLEGIQIHDFDWRYIYVNDALVKYSSYKREELLGFTIMEKYPGIEQTDLFKVMERCMNERVPDHLENEFKFPDGTKIHFELSIEPIAEGISILSVDRTEQKMANEKLLKANRLYSFISQINQSIVHIQEEEELILNSCRIAIQIGKFKMAWIGMVDTDSRKIRLMGHSGIAEEEIKLFDNVPYNKKGPQQHVLDTGSYFLCNDIENKFELESWRPFADNHNIRSCMVLPIKKSGIITGTFNLYSTELNFFDKEEIDLLIEVTGDISFALDSFEKEKRHRATEALVLKNERLFRALIENSADMITLSSEAGKMLYGSPSITKLFGYTLEDIINTSAFDFIHPDDISVFAKERNVLLQSPGKSYHNKIRLKHKNGKWIWCEATLTNMLHDPDIHALVSNFRDISEKRTAEDQKEFDSNNLNALINNTNDLMWSVDIEFKLITFNQPFYDTIKFVSGKELSKGDNIFSPALSEEQIDRFKISYHRAFAGEIFTEIEYIEAPVETWSEISYYPILNGAKVIGTACHSRNITERKRDEHKLITAANALENAVDDLQKIMDSSLDIICSIDEEGKFVTASAASEHILGYKPYELVGKKYLDMVWSDDVEKTMHIAGEVMNGSPATFFENRYLHRNGSLITLLWSATWDDNDKLMYCIAKDITEQKLAELEREKIASDIVRRNNDLEQFSYIISHNLRAPVANIIGLSEAVQNESIEPDVKKDLMEGLSNSVKKLDEVITDLNNILQLRNTVSEPKELISFSALTDDIYISIKNLVVEEKAVIKWDFTAVNEMLTLKSYMYSIFYNLIFNSLKYRQPDIGLIIEIKSWKSEDKIVLEFKDNGVGIDLDKKGEQVFGLYKRFHATLAEGKGIGLYMVRTQVEAMGGKITIDSSVNIGTTFTIEFENK